MRTPSGLITASLLALMSSPAVMAADEEKSAWSGSAELGSIRTSGNTSTSSTTGKFEVKHTGAQWDSRLRLTSLNSKDDGETSKEKYTAGVQFDRNFSETTYLAITADRNATASVALNIRVPLVLVLVIAPSTPTPCTWIWKPARVTAATKSMTPAKSRKKPSAVWL